jgi:hypothetical protein
VRKKYKSSIEVNGLTAPSPARENPLLVVPLIAKEKYFSTVSDKLLALMYMSFPIALGGPFNEKEVMEREAEVKSEGMLVRSK